MKLLALLNCKCNVSIKKFKVGTVIVSFYVISYVYRQASKVGFVLKVVSLPSNW